MMDETVRMDGAAFKEILGKEEKKKYRALANSYTQEKMGNGVHQEIASMRERSGRLRGKSSDGG